jgi:hypothetical protein
MPGNRTLAAAGSVMTTVRPPSAFSAVQRFGGQAGQDPGEQVGVDDHVWQVFRHAQRDVRAAWSQVF